MVKRMHAGGADGIWVFTKSPPAPEYCAVHRTTRRLELFRQDLAQAHLLLSRW